MKPVVTVKANVIHSQLARRNMTQADLAKAIGITRSYLSQVLRGKENPGPEIRQKLIAYFGLEFDQLFEFEETSKPVKTRKRELVRS